MRLPLQNIEAILHGRSNLLYKGILNVVKVFIPWFFGV